MLRRWLPGLVALLCAGAAQAQVYRPGFGFARPGFQFLGTLPCPNASFAYLDFQANTGCSGGTTLASSTAPLTTTRASTGYDLAASTLFAANTPRRTSAGLLVEGAATNLLLQTSAFDNASWGKSSLTVTGDATTGPEGTTSGDKLVENTATTVRYVTQNAGITASTAYTLSVFVKAGERKFLQVGLDNAGSNGGIVNVDSSLGTVTMTAARGTATGLVGAAVLYPSGYTAASITETLGTDTTGRAILFPMVSGTASYAMGYTGDGASGLFLWGAQLELGTKRSSYIPTTTGSATRAADTISLTLPAGTSKVDLAYSDNTTATITTSAGSYTLPNNPVGTTLKTLRAY